MTARLIKKHPNLSLKSLLFIIESRVISFVIFLEFLMEIFPPLVRANAYKQNNPLGLTGGCYKQGRGGMRQEGVGTGGV